MRRLRGEGCRVVVRGAVGGVVVVGLCWAVGEVGVVGARGEGLVVCCCHCGLRAGCAEDGQFASSCRLIALEYARVGRRGWCIVVYARGVVIS